MHEGKQPPPAAPTTRSCGQRQSDSHKGMWVHPGRNHVAHTTLDNTVAIIRSEIVELIDIWIERLQATTHGLIMSLLERLRASYWGTISKDGFW
jgi:hypothetical protein